MTDTYLETARVRLRQYRESDFPHIVELHTDPRVMRYLTMGVPETLDDTRAFVARTVRYQEQFATRLGVLTAELLHSGEFIGWFFLRPDEADGVVNDKELELGYRLLHRFWGQGFATEVSRQLLRLAFDHLGADGVYATATTDHVASQGAMTKLGMRFVGTSMDSSGGQPEEIVIYRIDRSTWHGVGGGS
jgi:RimJ/RimL family protein N-acetyltransferase